MRETGGRMKFSEWEATLPDAIRTDPLWRIEAYRLSLLLSDLAWKDATKLLGDARTAFNCRPAVPSRGQDQLEHLRRVFTRNSEGADPVLRVRTGLDARGEGLVFQGKACAGEEGRGPSNRDNGVHHPPYADDHSAGAAV